MLFRSAKKLEAFSAEDATKFAAFVAEKYLSTTKTEGTGTITLPSAGYYLIKDVTPVEGEYDASNLILLLVSGAEEVTPKVNRYSHPSEEGQRQKRFHWRYY